MNRKIMAIIAIAIIGTISVLGVTASMDDESDEHQYAEENEHDEQTPPESPPSEPHEETGKVEHFFEGTVDGGAGPSGGCHNHYFMVNSSVTSVVAVFRWEDTTWDLDVSIGKGDCPGSGEVVEEDRSGTIGNGEGEVTLECSDPATLEPEDGEVEKWFAHLEPDPYANECDYTVTVTVTYVYWVE